ncbi:MAG TPA: glycosyltransferase family 9 protein [Nitrospirota bacterium]|nr:glycosyltransferase family 9 protein [Nitrospirota bacterium]
MKTFIHHDGGLGDTLLSLPCLIKLRSGSSIHLAGRGDVAAFLQQAGAVDAATSTSSALFASLYGAVDDRFRQFLSGFDAAYLFTARDASDITAAFRAIVPATRVVKTMLPDGLRSHAAWYRLSQMDPMACVSADTPLLRASGENIEAAQSLLSKAGYDKRRVLLAVHPGSGGKAKCWPLDRYFEVIERLQALKDIFVLLFTGEAEENSIRKSVGDFTRGGRNRFHAADLDLIASVSLLSLCRLYIGNDSGFSHLAGLTGCRSIVLFGPTDPVIWKPIGPDVTVIAPASFAPMTEITVDGVLRCIETKLVTADEHG